MNIDTNTAKVMIGKAAQREADSLKSLLARHGVEIAAVHNQQTCTSGCSTQLELWAHPDDVPSIQQIMTQEWERSAADHGYDPQLAQNVFDPTAESATCPACATVFATTAAECPECGLNFGG